MVLGICLDLLSGIVFHQAFDSTTILTRVSAQRFQDCVLPSNGSRHCLLYLHVLQCNLRVHTCCVLLEQELGRQLLESNSNLVCPNDPFLTC